ncbi:hypothetical protein ST41_05305 [Prevotella pectinovora]|nr:hypothetical protein ST41_05305 [Prevotella pectinovora]
MALHASQLIQLLHQASLRQFQNGIRLLQVRVVAARWLKSIRLVAAKNNLIVREKLKESLKIN